MHGERPDQQPGFWCEYVPPANNVAALVQMPSHRIDGYSLSVAYMRDWRHLRSLSAKGGSRDG